MKRFVVMLLTLSLILCGCTVMGERNKEPVNFYYLRSSYQYFQSDGVIASEEREGTGHMDDLSYLLALYLMGPSQEELRSPLPEGTRIYLVKQEEQRVRILLSSLDSSLSDIDFSLAGACLAMTCFDLTDAQSVTVDSGERSVQLTRDNILQYTVAETTPEETQ